MTAGARRRRALLASAAGAALVLGGCGEASSGRPVVVATTTQVADFARAVGGDAVEVHQVLRPNTDPHEYEPRPRDVQKAADAALVLASGVGLDDWVVEMVAASGSGAETVVLGEGLEDPGAAAAAASGDGEADGHGETAAPADSHEHGDADPHWWHNPVHVIAAVRRIEAALARALPARAGAFRRNAAAYSRRLRALDAEIARCMRSLPASERKLVTSHESFGHFAERYGIRLVGAVVASRSTEAQASAGDVARLVRQIRREDVKAVFIDRAANPKLGEAVAREAGVIGDLRLHGDTLGPAGSDAASYVGMLRANAEAMMRGFTGGERGCA